MADGSESSRHGGGNSGDGGICHRYDGGGNRCDGSGGGGGGGGDGVTGNGSVRK